MNTFSKYLMIYLHENHKDELFIIGEYTSPMDLSWEKYSLLSGLAILHNHHLNVVVRNMKHEGFSPTKYRL